MPQEPISVKNSKSTNSPNFSFNLPLIRNLKLTLLSHRWSLQLYTTIRRCHQQSAPALLLEKLSFHENQHSTRGRQQGDFRPFQPASLAGRISFTNRAPLLWNMLPREVQTSSSMLVFKKNVLSLLDSPSSGKNLFTDLFWKHYHLTTFLLFFLFFFFPFA